MQVGEDEVLFGEGWEGFGRLYLGEMLVEFEMWVRREVPWLRECDGPTGLTCSSGE